MKTTMIFKILHLLTWIIFVVDCIVAGTILLSSIAWLALPQYAEHFYKWNALTALYQSDKGNFIFIISIICIVTILKAYLFYLILKLMSKKNLNLTRPFSVGNNRLISIGAMVSIFIGIISKYGFEYSKPLFPKGIQMPDAFGLGLDGAEVWILMGVILSAIAQVFKRGIELQTENDFTV